MCPAGIQIQVHVTALFSTGRGHVTCVQLSEGGCPLLYPLGLWSRDCLASTWLSAFSRSQQDPASTYITFYMHTLCTFTSVRHVACRSTSSKVAIEFTLPVLQGLQGALGAKIPDRWLMHVSGQKQQMSGFHIGFTSAWIYFNADGH